MKAVSQAAVDLPWLSPCADSLVALARESPAAAWPVVRTDPGAVLLLERFADTARNAASSACESQLAGALQAAWFQLANQKEPDRPAISGFVDWNDENVRPIYQAAICCAGLAEKLAEECNRADSRRFWSAGLLAPLGWLGLAAADAKKTGSCWKKCRETLTSAVESRHRSYVDSAAIARRLNQKWKLPTHLAAITGHLSLSVDMAVPLGADADLFRIVQLSAALLAGEGHGISVRIGGTIGGLSSELNIDRTQAEVLCRNVLAEAEPTLPAVWQSPCSRTLLVDLLALAVENRTLQPERTIERLQREIDVLQEAVQTTENTLSARLHERKMSALAEFAAGAAHEINNPLAVISGHAQYLLKRETDADCRETLDKIICQTRRVHSILTGVRQFARPAEPKKQLLNAATLIRQALDNAQPLAAQRKVQLIFPETHAPVNLFADPDQIGRALDCLLQNAIEATPEDGYAGVRMDEPTPGTLHLIVEDGGTGPDVPDPSLLFDPFYSGREAGRGRGLGLPLAWRLARLHGGDVFLSSAGNGSTRFVLSLPIATASENTVGRNGAPSDALVSRNGAKLQNGIALHAP